MSKIIYSPEDEYILSKYKWSIHKDGYVKGYVDKKKWRLHRYIYKSMGFDLDRWEIVDHINGIKHDNRRENLRITSAKENAQNRKKQYNASSIYFGVFKHKKFGYQVSLKIDEDKTLRTCFKDELHAAYQYDLWLQKYPNSFKKKNNIECPNDFEEYEEKIETIIPKNISKTKYNTFVVRYKKNPSKTFKTLEEAKGYLDKLKTNEEETHIQNIKSSKILKDNDGNTYILINNKNIIVDDEDYNNLLINGKLYIGPDNYTEIFIKSINKRYKLHRYLLNCFDKDKIVDHINGNRLDNRKCNLRIVTHQQNSQNKKSSINATSQYIGVDWFKKTKKWRASIMIEGKNKHLGLFDDEIDAAKARDKATMEYFGGYGRTNFPDVL